MAGRFAGSRSLDERRRRRIAGEQDGFASVEPEGPERRAVENAAKPPPTPRRKTRRLPLRLIISPRFWKHAIFGFLVFAAGAAILWAGAESDVVGVQAGPDIERLVDPADGRLVKAFGGLLLLLSAQLALLICFVRARSHTDFSGRYRIWGWAALVGLIASASVLLDLHIVWSRSLGWWLQMKFEKLETLCWLAPAVGCGSVLIRDLLADTRSCRGSNVAIRLAIVFWASACVQILGYGLGLADRHGILVESGLAMLGHYFLFVGLMLHSRHVIFVDAEPPAERPSILVRLVKSTIKRLRHKRKQRKLEAEKLVEPIEKSKPEELKAAAEKPGQNLVKRADPVVDKPESQELQESVESAPKRSKNGKSIRIDEPHDLDELAGMSKRERRRQRKQKQSQRKAARRDRDG